MGLRISSFARLLFALITAGIPAHAQVTDLDARPHDGPPPGMAPAAPPASASFVMDRITFGSAARRASSASFEIRVTFAQEGPVGSASLCNVGFVQNTGFWSIMGYVPVPVVLRAARNVADSFDVDLDWTGASPSFEIYRSTDPDGIVDPANLAAVTSDCAATDTPPSATIVYYRIVPVGP